MGYFWFYISTYWDMFKDIHKARNVPYIKIIVNYSKKRVIGIGFTCDNSRRIWSTINLGHTGP